MKKLYAFILVLAPFFATAQPVLNGGFENWTNHPYDSLDTWVNSNPSTIRWSNTLSAFKTTDSQSGLALKLQTVITGTDTMVGYTLNHNANVDEGQSIDAGGVPYAASPTALTGYCKYNLPGNDTALLLVIFKKNGTVISFDTYKFKGATGVQNTWIPFTMPISQLVVTPDTVIIGAVSSNVFVSGTNQNGSTLYLDELAFTGATAMPPIVNGSFENWSTGNYAAVDDWDNTSSFMTRTTDSYQGNYAMLMWTDQNDNGPSAGVLHNGYYLPSSMGGGIPYTSIVDTLRFFYKYQPSGTDQARVMLYFRYQNNMAGYQQELLPAASSYTEKKIEILPPGQVDSLIILFESSNWPVSPSAIGSMLKIDNVELTSQPLKTAKNFFTKISVYPVPASEYVNFQFATSGTATIRIMDAAGREVINLNDVQLSASSPYRLDISGLADGIYTYSVFTSEKAINGKFIRK